MENKDWLRNLKEGDPVVLYIGRYNGGYEIAKVDKITPTGRLKVRGYTFLSDGKQYGHSGFSNYARIMEPTEDMLEKARINEFNKKWKNVMFDLYHEKILLGFEEKRKIIDIVEGWK